MTQGARYSLFLHGALILFAVFGLPEIFRRHAESLPTVMTVELLPVRSMTNIKPVRSTPTPAKKEEKKAVEQKKATAKKATSATSSNQPKPVEKKEAVPLPDAEPEEKKPEEKEEEKPQKADDLDAILKSVADAAKRDEGEKQEEETPAEEPEKTTEANATEPANNATEYNDALPLSMSEIDAIRSQITRCWNVPAGAKDAHTLKVMLHIELNQDGSLISVDLAEDKIRYQADSFFRAAADSAMRAVHQCSPLQNLPPEKYGTWKSIDMLFDPKEVLY